MLALVRGEGREWPTRVRLLGLQMCRPSTRMFSRADVAHELRVASVVAAVRHLAGELALASLLALLHELRTGTRAQTDQSSECEVRPLFCSPSLSEQPSQQPILQLLNATVRESSLRSQILSRRTRRGNAQLQSPDHPWGRRTGPRPLTLTPQYLTCAFSRCRLLLLYSHAPFGSLADICPPT